MFNFIIWNRNWIIKTTKTNWKVDPLLCGVTFDVLEEGERGRGGERREVVALNRYISVAGALGNLAL